MKIEISRFGQKNHLGGQRRKKVNAIWGVVIFLVIVVSIVTAITIVVEHNMESYVLVEQKETWVASVASYWGGIIGGVVSGILSFLGVFYTIRYYKESDVQKERASIQPFFWWKLT